MQVNKFNISKPDVFKNKQGVEQKQWNNVGTMTEFVKDDGSVSRIIEIPAIGLKASVFPFKPLASQADPLSTNSNQTSVKPNLGVVGGDTSNLHPESTINPEDIPF